MDIVRNSFKDFSKIFLDSSFHMKNGIEVFKTEVDHWSMNFCFIGGEVTGEGLTFIKEKLDVNSLIFCKSSISKELKDVQGIHYIGEFPYMERKESRESYYAPFYDDIEILTVREYPGAFKDFVKVFSEIRGLDESYLMSKINMSSLTTNNFFFVAYISNIPVGIFYAISYGENAFIVEASVKENYRNSGILTAMAKSAKEEAIKHGIYNFYTIPTSDFSIKVINEQGYNKIGSYHIWQNVK